MSRAHACVSEGALYSVFALTAAWIPAIICAFFSVASGLIVAPGGANMAAETPGGRVTSLIYATLSWSPNAKLGYAAS